MNAPSRSGGGDGALHVLWEDGERVFCRTWREDAQGGRREFTAVTCASEQPAPKSANRLIHEFGLKDHLDGAWALRPLDLTHERGRTILLLEPTRGEPLDRLIGQPMEVGKFLRLAVALSAALCPLHQRGIVHKDIKPSNIIVDVATHEIRLTGFGVASRLPRERQAPGPPEVIAGTLAYMAPEQTGRMNRSIDSRSDLYALGVTLYEMLTGSLPFTASDPMEWVHCHIARRAIAPRERTNETPEALSSIVMKLLAKTPEERYQTAAGVEADLRLCLGEWQAHGRIDPFPVGERDASDRLLITEELYGREREIDSLLASFERVIAQGAPELVLVSGYSGVGKSSLVNELHKALALRRGLFAAGKFDQYKRDIPYATLAQAFQALIRQILLKSEAEVEQWRSDLKKALGGQGQLIVNLVPELEFIVGKQPAVPDLPPRDAQNRFQLVFRRFLGAFARPQHPLALFLDDLQWLDAATLDLIEHLITHGEVKHLLVVGAYRDNEVDSAHPLSRTLQAIKKTDARVGEIVLAPLGPHDVGRLVASALLVDIERARPLTELVYEKTGGNPFFAIQFLAELAEQGLLEFHHVPQGWRWEIDRIRAKGYTDNVVDLMVEKLKRLSPAAQEAMKLLACLGHAAEIGTLTMGYEETEEAMHATLREAVYAGLIEQQDGAYRFMHDRIQQAAYSLIPDRRRADIHLQIGRALLASMTEDQLAEHLFDVVSQFNRATALIASRDEREQLARLNLIAGRRAKASMAYASALKYLASGASLLQASAWRRRRDLIFSLELLRAECEFLTGELAAAETRLDMLSKRAAGAVEQAAVVCLRMDLYTTLDQAGRALAVGLDYLRLQGIDSSTHPSDEEVRREYERVWSQLGDRTIEALIDLPLMTDPASLAMLDVLIKLWPAALFTDKNVFAFTVCRAVNLSLDHGNSDGSCVAYVRLGGIAGSRFGDYEAALRLGRLGCELVEQRGLKRFQARTHMLFGCCILPWAQPVTAARDVLRRAYLSASESGDLTFVAYSAMSLNSNLLAANDPLAEVEREAEHGLAFAQKMQFGLAVDTIATQLQLARMLRGLTPTFGSFDDERFSEHEIRRRFSDNPNLGYAECYYWIRKLQASVLAGDHAGAVDASLRPLHLLWTVRSLLEMAEYHFYASLARAACCDSASPEQRQQHLEALAAHRQEIEIWARHCPENFANRAALIGAELARLEGRDDDAMRLYEQAIRSARKNGFVHNEALAYETAARFYSARGFETFANAYLRRARDCYLRWGADGKVRQLDRLYPDLVGPAGEHPATGIGFAIRELDVASVVKASQAVSGEIELPKLIERLMTIAIETAGADRGLLILPAGDEYLIQAEARTTGDPIEVTMRLEPITPLACPESVVRYVIRTKESVILDDAKKANLFSADGYLRDGRSKSILCLPLVKQQKLTGILFLENTLTSHAFTPARIGVLELLAAQAAISLENTRLYSDLQEREAKVRSLVDANIIGILIGNLDGDVQEANQAFLDIVGYDQADLAAGRLRRAELTPAEWHDRDAQALIEMKKTGTSQPYEKEYFRKDGSRVPVLVGAATFGEGRYGVVAFVVDLSDRMRAEDAERRYHEVQMELAHANRVAILGQLSASIAHEINQPLAGIITNASTGLRMLTADPPNVEGARETARRTIRDGNRANEVIKRLRALFSKKDLTIESVDLNEATREVIALSLNEFQREGVIWRAELAGDLPLVRCDRVQLQQVVLNLVRNGLDAMSAADGRPKQLVVRTATSEPDWVTLAVQDSGPGVDPANLERIFDAFYSTKPGGLGMGLAVCRAIVEAHGGKLWAATCAPSGATFQLTLPVTAAGL